MEGTIRGIADRLLSALGRQCVAEVEQLRLVAELVDASAFAAPRPVVGGERLVDSGSDGTPQVAEFLVPELAAMLGVGIPTAWALIRDVMNLRHRHPQAWAALGAEDGSNPLMRAWQARKVASMCAAAELGADAARWVDSRLASSWGRLPWQRVRRKCEGLIVCADRSLARGRVEARRAERYVYVRHEGDGSSLMVARMNTADAVQLSRAVDTIANSMVLEGRSEPRPELRSEALAELARPSDRGTLPRHSSTFVVHVSRETRRRQRGGPRGRGGPVAPRPGTRAVGPRSGAVTAGARSRWRRWGGQLRDSRPDARAGANPGSVLGLPVSTTRSVNADMDHTQPFAGRSANRDHAPPSQTRPSNLGPLGRLEHRAKTHGGWRVSQSEPGVFEWQSPFGFRYRVDRGYTEALDPNREKRVVPISEGAGPVVDLVVPPCLAVIDYAA